MWFSWQSMHRGLSLIASAPGTVVGHGCNPSRSEMEVKGPEFKLHSKFKVSLGSKRLDFYGNVLPF